jgi:hypothetical protein
MVYMYWLRVFASSVVDRGFDEKTIKCADLPLSAQYYEIRVKTGWFRIMLMCPSGTTCLPPDCCFSELAL